MKKKFTAKDGYKLSRQEKICQTVEDTLTIIKLNAQINCTNGFVRVNNLKIAQKLSKELQTLGFCVHLNEKHLYLDIEWYNFT